MKARGTETAVVATLNATKCASPVQVLTANTAPKCCRRKVTAAESAPNASSPSRTTKMPANESSQFSVDHATQINPAKGRKRMKDRPGLGFASEEEKLTRTAAPTKARIADRVSATRRKLSAASARQGRGS